ncbi:hypothetical protein AURDEDRAFT_124558 [Auricularia subglabra TFB-10046 SS5]|nr:hypothetical protein AURDEDRAFT_124558 [Auricularia subglabra TFB-10046 SS5]
MPSAGKKPARDVTPRLAISSSSSASSSRPAHHAGTPARPAFRNPWTSAPSTPTSAASYAEWLRARAQSLPGLEWAREHPAAAHIGPLSVVAPDFTPPSDGEVKATWLGHASVPAQLPRSPRVHTPSDPPVISHNHEHLTEPYPSYDHLDLATILGIHAKQGSRVTYLVPLGYPHLVSTTASGQAKASFELCRNKAWFTSCGIPEDQVHELDWWESFEPPVAISEHGAGAAPLSKTLKLTCVPAQHSSGRGLTDQRATLWCGWVVELFSTPARSPSASSRTGAGFEDNLAGSVIARRVQPAARVGRWRRELAVARRDPLEVRAHLQPRRPADEHNPDCDTSPAFSALQANSEAIGAVSDDAERLRAAARDALGFFVWLESWPTPTASGSSRWANVRGAEAACTPGYIPCSRDDAADPKTSDDIKESALENREKTPFNQPSPSSGARTAKSSSSRKGISRGWFFGGARLQPQNGSYPAPDSKYHNWLCSGIALRVATDLLLHRPPPRAHAPSDETLERKYLSRTRMWIMYFSLDESMSALVGWPPTSARGDVLLRIRGPNAEDAESLGEPCAKLKYFAMSREFDEEKGQPIQEGGEDECLVCSVTTAALTAVHCVDDRGFGHRFAVKHELEQDGLVPLNAHTVAPRDPFRTFSTSFFHSARLEFVGWRQRRWLAGTWPTWSFRPEA